MSNQNKSFDKVNMSLDEIIKLNRNQNRQNKFAVNRNLNGNNNRSNNNGNRNQFSNNRNNNNRRRNDQRRQQPHQQQSINKKPYGMLNKSKTIQKRNNIPNKQKLMILNNNKNNQQMARKFPRNLANRRRRVANNTNNAPQRLFNRFGSSGGVNKYQNGQKQQSNNQQKQNRVKKFRQIPVKNVNTQKKLQQLRQPRSANNMKNRIAMQSARKNVMKAKRLLARKSTVKKAGPIQQIMTQRYAKSLGLIQAKRPNSKPTNARSIPKQNKMLTVNINNRINKANRVKQVQKKTIQKAAKTQFKKPILNRNRQQQQQQGQQSNAGRKVFF